MPRVSVVVPTYNRADLLLDAVNSVLAQTMLDLEVVVVDDGSTDQTRETVSQFGEPVRYIYQANRGRSAARNRGIHEARGEYLLFLDSDDLLLPRSLEVLAYYLESHPEAGAVTSECVYFDSEGQGGGEVREEKWERSPDPGKFLDTLALTNTVGAIHSTLVRREWLDRIDQPCFDEELEFTEDADLWFRLAAAGCHFHVLPEVTCKYRMHGGNTNAPGCMTVPRYRRSYRRARLKVWESDVFPQLAARTQLTFLYLLLLDPTYGDDTLHDEVLASARFAALSPDVQSQILYLVGIEDTRRGRAAELARARLGRAARLKPRALKFVLASWIAFISPEALVRCVASARELRKVYAR